MRTGCRRKRAISSSRPLKKAHLRHPSSGWVPGALARRYDVRTKYASHLHASCGWVPGAPPCIWTFLSSLAENEFFSILLASCSRDLLTISRNRREELVLCPVNAHSARSDHLANGNALQIRFDVDLAFKQIPPTPLYQRGVGGIFAGRRPK